MNTLQESWYVKWRRAAERADEGLRRERVLRDAIRWHEQAKGHAATAVDHELYRTAEANQ